MEDIFKSIQEGINLQREWIAKSFTINIDIEKGKKSPIGAIHVNKQGTWVKVSDTGNGHKDWVLEKKVKSESKIEEKEECSKSELKSEKIKMNESFPKNFNIARENLTTSEMFQKTSKGKFKDQNELYDKLGGKENLEKKLKSFINDSAVYMAIKSGTLIREIINKSDAFKNSLETGKGSFKTIGEERTLKEKFIFGIDTEANSSEADNFPKYGFISSKEEMSYEPISEGNYGNAYVKFKTSAVKDRTSITLGDSFNDNGSISYKGQIDLTSVAPPTKLNDVDDKLIWGINNNDPNSDMWNKINEAKNIDEFTEASVSSYMEAQIYGKLSIDDVDSIFVSSIKEADSFNAALKKAGREIKVLPCKFDNRLNNLVGGYHRGDGPRYRASLNPSDIDNLGDYYIDILANKWLAESEVEVKHNALPSGLVLLAKKYNQFTKDEQGRKVRIHSDISMEDKRNWLKKFYELMSNGDDGGMPFFWREDYRKTIGGFTDDVMNKKLLIKYK